VIAREQFGVFMDIDGHPDALGLMEITAPGLDGVLPAIGSSVEAVVVDHRAHNCQLRLWPRSRGRS
jgi:hypothetical protein